MTVSKHASNKGNMRRLCRCGGSMQCNDFEFSKTRKKEYTTPKPKWAIDMHVQLKRQTSKEKKHP